MALANEGQVNKRRRRGEFLHFVGLGEGTPRFRSFPVRKEMKTRPGLVGSLWDWGIRSLMHRTGRWHDLRRAGDNPNAEQKIDEAPRVH